MIFLHYNLEFFQVDVKIGHHNNGPKFIKVCYFKSMG